MKKILITWAGGYIAVLILGMLLYRIEIFNPHTHYFQIVVFGFIGAVLYPVMLYLEKREIIFITSLLVLLHFIIFKPSGVTYFIRDIAALTSLIVTLYFYTLVVLPALKKRFDMLRVLALGLFYGGINAAAGLILSALLFILFDTSAENIFNVVLVYAGYGLLIGAGLAIGFNFAEFVLRSSQSE